MFARSAAVSLGVAVVAWTLAAIAPGIAAADITSVFNENDTPVPCTILPSGVRLCDETAYQPPRDRSTVRAFDGVPLDVRVAFPSHISGPDGPYPLIIVFHRYAGEKAPLQSLTGWIGRGYAAMSMTDRGFGESCGSQASRDADPSGCANGYMRMMDTRYEVRDAQDLIGELVDDGVVDPARIGATGNSYGGGKAVALAALKDREMLPSGFMVPWTSPRGTPISLAAAAATSAWTDLMAALAPNGTTLDYVQEAPYTGRTGVLKTSSENSFYAFGAPWFYAPVGTDPSADITGWHTLLNAGEPYDDSHGNPLDAAAAMRVEMSSHHSPYYIDDSEPPAPLMIANGLTDDFFPADEAIRFFNRSRTRHLGVPISLVLADVGHARAQQKPADTSLVAAREQAWLAYYVDAVGSPPYQGVEVWTQTCPASAPSDGPYRSSSWAAAAPGEIRLDFSPLQQIIPGAGSASVAQTFDPIGGPGACATAPAADQDGTASYRSTPVGAGGFTLLGSPTVVADITSPGSDSEIAARLLDVDPATDTETLVARGLWRPAISDQAARQVFQLHPNGYRFAPGHVVKLELLPSDDPYGRASNNQDIVEVENLELRLPVLEAPGALGGLVEDPAPKVVPPGYALARDFAPPRYVRPRGASPVQVALVPAYRQCTAPRRSHGAPLAFGSCAPPVQASSNLTVGTPDANGRFANSIGSAYFGVVPDNPATSVNESDVRISVSISDVRRTGDLSDYTGELQTSASLRITDQANGSGGEPATVVDTPLRATVACAATAQVDRGASCSVLTSANALAPGTVAAGVRAIWEVGTIELDDGGADGVASTTADNQVFARQGLFIP